MGYTRRDFLKKAAYVAGAISTGQLLSGCADEVSTEKAYGSHWKAEAYRRLEKIEALNSIIDKNTTSKKSQDARKELMRFYIDPVLQEFPELQKSGMVRGDTVRLGDYEIKVLDYQKPWIPDGRSTPTGPELKIELYEKGQKIDLNPPFTQSKRINLRGKDWSIEKIMKDSIG